MPHARPLFSRLGPKRSCPSGLSHKYLVCTVSSHFGERLGAAILAPMSETQRTRCVCNGALHGRPVLVLVFPLAAVFLPL